MIIEKTISAVIDNCRMTDSAHPVEFEFYNFAFYMVFCYINLLSAALAFQHIVLNLPTVTTCWWPVFKTTVMCTGVNCKRLFWLSASVIMSHCAWCVAKWANIEWSSSAVNKRRWSEGGHTSASPYKIISVFSFHFGNFSFINFFTHGKSSSKLSFCN